MGYNTCLVVLGGELAVPFSRNPHYAGLNPPWRVLFRRHIILIGRRATDTHEPCQIRKEAAISDGVCVADRSRSVFNIVNGNNSIGGAQPFLFAAGFNFPVFPQINSMQVLQFQV